MDAYEAGKEHGLAQGSWVIDGNTDEPAARAILAGFDEGDPITMDLCPAPLSGEWAGESIKELSAGYDVDLEDEDNADAFELGFSDGFWEAVQSAARGMLLL